MQIVRDLVEVTLSPRPKLDAWQNPFGWSP